MKRADVMAIACPYCGRTVERRHSVYGWWFQCNPCDAKVGCHKGTSAPLGTMAKAPLRQKRMDAHAAFDPTWKMGTMKRKAAYAKLADALEINRHDCHIAQFDESTCDRVVMICDQWKRDAG